jgi:hypothetical protein
MLEAGPDAAAPYVVLKVETHLHTVHSDGKDTVTAMFEACRHAGYDVVALTDHNTMSGLTEAGDAAADLGLVLLPGVEITTFHGHAIALGVSRVPEWRDLEQRGVAAIAADVHADGGLLCLAHPAALGSPVCSGCAWEWPIEPGAADLWEVFSAPRPNVSVAAALWQQRLGAGERLGPVAAGDVHSRAAAAASRVATYVMATERSETAVLDALRQRRMFTSAGPRLDFWLSEPSGRVALPGEQVEDGTWTAHTTPGASIREVLMDGGGRVLFAELKDQHGALVALSAPIWIVTSQ